MPIILTLMQSGLIYFFDSRANRTYIDVTIYLLFELECKRILSLTFFLSSKLYVYLFDYCENRVYV